MWWWKQWTVASRNEGHHGDQSFVIFSRARLSALKSVNNQVKLTSSKKNAIEPARAYTLAEGFFFKYVASRAVVEGLSPKDDQVVDCVEE